MQPIFGKIADFCSCLVVLSCFALVSCDSPADPDSGADGDPLPIGGSPVVAGERVFGVAPIAAVDAGETFGDIFPVLNSIGMKYIESALQWDEIEVAADTYDYSSTGVANLNVFLPLTQWRVSLSINAIDTNNDRRPQRFRALAWDDPALIDAYWALVEMSIAQFPVSQILGISIGNEVDVYFAANPDQQSAYVKFAQAIQQRLTQSYPNFRNGVKTTVAGALNNSATFISNLNQSTDVVMASYYAIDNDFRGVSPDNAVSNLNAYVALFPEREVHFLEMGAMSSTACGSSNEMQAQFVRNVFSFWDSHADQVKLINFVWMTDLSASMVNEFTQYYGVADPCFREYLATLGFRDSTGMDKGALLALQAEVSARGF